MRSVKARVRNDGGEWVIEEVPTPQLPSPGKSQHTAPAGRKHHMIRATTPDDAQALGAFFVKSWRDALSGVVPAEALAQDDPAEVAADCTRNATDPRRIFTLAMDGSSIMGVVVAVLPQRQGEPGSINSLYVDQSHYRKGLGRRLMGHVAAAMLERGVTSLTLGVLRDNLRARRFYDAQGGVVTSETTYDWNGHLLPKLNYLFSDLPRLVALGQGGPDAQR
jgi:ribosomal protein S18 acetylase RimI-like enzyme